MDQRDDTEKETEMEEIIKHTVQKCLLEQSHIFLNWLHRMKKLGTLTVDKEVQKNDWFVANIEERLQRCIATINIAFSAGQDLTLFSLGWQITALL